MIRFIAVLGFIGLNFYIYNFLANEAVVPPRDSFESFPDELGAWRCLGRVEMEDEVLRNLGATDYLLCEFGNPELRKRVAVYVGYHASQIREEGGGAGENSIHPPAHCLPGSGWDVIDSRIVPIEFPGLPEGAMANRLVIAKGNERQLVYYWYQSRGRVIHQDWQKIVYVGLDRAIQGRTDGSLVRYTTPIIRSDEASADAAILDVATRVSAELPRFVPN